MFTQTETSKRQRIQPKNKTMFDNTDDETQCLQIICALDSTINIDIDNYKITLPLLKEIAQYSTGNFIKCKGECDGYIHFLKGDNFKKDLNCFNCLNLYKYQCDDNNCSTVSHVMTCHHKDCNKIITIKQDSSPYPKMSICENALRLNPSCSQVYCIQHTQKNGRTCQACNNFYCYSCGNQGGGKHCSTCDKYWCQDHIEEATFSIGTTYYCDKCMFSVHCNDPSFIVFA